MAFNDIRRLLGNNEIKKAIETFRKKIEDPRKIVILENIAGQWKSLKEQDLKGIISQEDKTLTENQIRNRLLVFLNELNEDYPNENIPIRRKNYSKNTIIIFSILILFFGYVLYQHYQNAQFYGEKLEIIVNRYQGYYKTEITDTSPNSIGCWYDITLINNSNVPISIVHFQPRPINEPQVVGRSYGLFQKMNSQKVDYPIELGPKKSIRLKLKIGLNLSNKAFKIIEDKFADLENLKFGAVLREVNSKEIDLFGNRVIFKEHSDGMYETGIDTRDVHQTLYYLVFKTSSGEEFKTKIGYYQTQLMKENKDIRFYPK